MRNKANLEVWFGMAVKKTLQENHNKWDINEEKEWGSEIKLQETGIVLQSLVTIFVHYVVPKKTQMY